MTKIDKDTVAKLRELGLDLMADAYSQCMRDPSFAEWTPSQIFSHVVETQYVDFYNKRFNTLLKTGGLENEPGDINNIYPHDGRVYSPVNVPEQLKTLDFIRDGYNLTILGASDAGKSYLATSLGIEACRKGMKTQFTSFSMLLDRLYEITLLDDAAKKKRILNNYSRCSLLIIDDFLITSRAHSSNIAALIVMFFDLLKERERRRNSTIVTTQFAPDEWNAALNDTLQTKASMDAIRRRLINNGYIVTVEKKDS